MIKLIDFKLYIISTRIFYDLHNFILLESNALLDWKVSRSPHQDMRTATAATQLCKHNADSLTLCSGRIEESLEIIPFTKNPYIY